MSELQKIAAAIVAPGKGILAADESTSTIEKRFSSIGVESTEDRRRAYREILFTTEGVEEFVSGVILYDETIRQNASDGRPFVEILRSKGIIPGIKTDAGAKDLANFPGEKVTEGLDGLRERNIEYARLGAQFAKWRAVITIGDGIPSDFCLSANAHALARYAALSQETGLVPIVEPEVLMDGDHDLDACYDVTHRALTALYEQLDLHKVELAGTLLKPNMVLPGKGCRTAPPEEVAEATIRCFKETVPEAVPGIVFLSGGQGDEEATANLNAMNTLGPLPWELSFSYGRALQAPALKAWGGDDAKADLAKAAFYHRSKMNGLARSGSWTEDAEAAI
ncbi:MAG TPA: class I fructose-bisphosphate aldolase [Acidimicrobiia bacterium]|nr:class I fructose-bisphosphate aldolase [Acidimicrobiia bacterium]